MPSLKRVHVVAVFVLLGLAALLYSVVLAQPLLGVGVAVASFVVAAFAYYGDANRETITRATIIITLIYGAFTLQLPIAVVTACIVYLTAWLTGPDSPLGAPDTTIFPVEPRAPDEYSSSE